MSALEQQTFQTSLKSKTYHVLTCDLGDPWTVFELGTTFDSFVAKCCDEQLWNGRVSKKEKEFRLHLPTLQCYIIELLVGIFFYVSHRVLATSSGAHVLQASLVKCHLKLQKLLCWLTVAASNVSWPRISWTPWEILAEHPVICQYFPSQWISFCCHSLHPFFSSWRGTRHAFLQV